MCSSSSSSDGKGSFYQSKVLEIQIVYGTEQVASDILITFKLGTLLLLD
jgi:hypothetical protein